MSRARSRSETRVNGHAADVCERAAALRWRLERDDRISHDARATAATPGLEEGTRIETKACRPWIANGDQYGTAGRFHINRRSHQRLLEDLGWYALVVYDLVQHPGGHDHVLAYAFALYPAARVDEVLPETHGTAVKLPWRTLFDISDLPDRLLEYTGGDA